ncbi:MAG: YraN family protein [Chitinophaga sp.]|uniref:YraN family protein n=1 Tax=Chitinophaga sp. TaxID=1869181 RepID=UPI0025BD8E8E|nr:YraN family protein [Chitinophaga sp.]MBV8251094.1 YraN family protein [Chitinophaga sp.]
MNSNRNIGKQGEQLAAQYTAGYCSIRHVNWKYGRYELDIIAERGGTIYFIEVKTRSSTHFGFPEDAVTVVKEAHIRAAAAHYLETYDLHPQAIRFDIISIVLRRGHSPELVHLKDVF